MGQWDWSPYAVGGAARPDSFSGMAPEFNTALQRAIAEAPPEIQAQLRISSGYRSPERQTQLWNEALAKYGSPEAARRWVAPPGRSQHNHGNAADVRFESDAAREWFHANAANYGLAFPLSNEPWHVELASARGTAPPQGAPQETLSTSGLLNEAPQMDEPQQGPLGGLLGIKRDTSKINDLGLALMALSSPRAAPAFMEMAKGRREEAAGRRKEREEAGRANRTVEWLAQQPGGQQFAALAEALGPQAAVQAYMQAQKAAADAAGGVEYGLTPQYGVDAEGNPVLIQIGKNGTATQTALPEGVTFQKEPIRIDAGTHWVLLDPITRQPVGQIEKDSRGDARNTAIGRAEGEAAGTAITGAPQAIAKADQSIELIDSILADPALPGITGMVQGRLPPMTQAGTDLGVKIEQLQSRVFLEAFETLKGAGQITEREGAAAQAALARLNRAQSTEEYKAALTELRGIITGATDRIRGAAGAAAPAAGPADNDPLGLRK